MSSEGMNGADGRRAEFTVAPQPTPPLWLSAAKCGRSGCCSPAFLHWDRDSCWDTQPRTEGCLLLLLLLLLYP